jgi:hypothetical protein
MKIRHGFVSNSSSSSYLIVGTIDDNTINNIIKAKKTTIEKVIEEMSSNQGIYDDGDIVFIGNDSIEYAGTELNEDEMDNLCLKIIKQNFADMLKDKYKICVPATYIHMYYGEIST